MNCLSKKLLIFAETCRLSQALANYARKKNVIVDWINPRELFDNFKLDTILYEDGKIHTTLESENLSVKFDSHCGVFSYFQTIPNDIVSSFREIDRDYVYHELISYLGALLSGFKNVINEPFLSPFGSTATLPYQWTLVQNLSNVKVPEYKLSFKEKTTDDTSQLIETLNFHEYDNWRERRIISNPNNMIYLAYQIPYGTPIACWFIDGKFWHMNIDNGREILGSDDDFFKIEQLTTRLANQFRLRLGQIIYFFSNDVTFGSISPVVSFNTMSKSIQERFIEELYARLTYE